MFSSKRNGFILNTKKSFLIILCVIVAVVASLSLASCKSNEQDPGKAEATYYERLVMRKDQIQKMVDFKPQVAIVLGSGFGNYVEGLEVVETIPYDKIQGWPNSSAPGHAGNLVFARYKGVNLAIMQGRVHYYEGYSMEEVVLPLRVLHLMGADTCILTNAVGAINPTYRPGEFVCVRDHISSFVPSPLIGENIAELGERFTPMTDIYDKKMQETLFEVARNHNIPLHSGIYLQTTGPQYETPSEIVMYRNMGADTVAMSLAVEAIAAAHMNMKICGINCVSNMAAGMEEEGFSHDNVSQTVASSKDNCKLLINGLLESLEKK